MPPIQILPGPMVDPYGFANSEAMAHILEVLGQSRKKKYENSIFSRLLEGEMTPEGISRAIEASRAENQANAPKSIISGLLNAFNPAGAYTGGPTGIENLAMSRILEDPLEGRLKQARLEAAQALTKQRQEGKVKPQEERIEELIKMLNSSLGAYYGVEGGNAKPKNPTGARYALDELKKLGVGTGEAIERATIGNKPAAEQQEDEPPSPEFLQIWPRLDLETKTKVKKALQNGYSADEILASLGG